MRHQSLAPYFLACGIVGPLQLVTVTLIEGATRPGYSAWRHAVSQLSLGENGWVNSITIFLCGLSLLGFAVGLRRMLRTGNASVWGPRLSLLCGVLFIVAAIFPINPGLGYPPGVTPSYSPHGLIHALAVTLLFGCLSALCFVVGQRFVGNPAWRGWELASRLIGVVVALFYIATTIVTTLDLNGVLPDAPGGLLQRVAIFGGMGWIALLALRLLRTLSKALSLSAIG